MFPRKSTCTADVLRQSAAAAVRAPDADISKYHVQSKPHSLCQLKPKFAPNPTHTRAPQALGDIANGAAELAVAAAQEGQDIQDEVGGLIEQADEDEAEDDDHDQKGD